MTEKMKASVLVKPGVLEVQDVEVPEIGEEEVLVKVAYAGICGSDVPRANLENGARMYPLILGHEFSGTVDRVGSRVTKVHVGDKIAVAPLIPDPNSEYTKAHVSVTGVSPSTPPLPKGFTYTRTFHCVLTRQYQPHGPTTPQTQPLPSITRSWFGLFRFLSPILTAS
jgi:NADPH:quinone reductase-like Zn-dependent oxidoreductase